MEFRYIVYGIQICMITTILSSGSRKRSAYYVLRIMIDGNDNNDRLQFYFDWQWRLIVRIR